MKAPAIEGYYTTREAAKVLKCSLSTVKMWVDAIDCEFVDAPSIPKGQMTYYKKVVVDALAECRKPRKKYKLNEGIVTRAHKKEDPYGVMVKPQFRGRVCPCGSGIPLPTGTKL